MKPIYTQIIKPFIPVLLVSIAFGIIYMTYFYLIGIPKTQARHYYNLGSLSLQDGNKDKAIEYFSKALTYWAEGYIKSTLIANQ